MDGENQPILDHGKASQAHLDVSNGTRLKYILNFSWGF